MRIRKNLFLSTVTAIFLLFSAAPSGFSETEDVSVRMDIIYQEEMTLVDPGEPLPVNICFDFLRDQKNYSLPFTYEISLICNQKTAASETGAFEPPDGVAIKRTTICKTVKFIPSDFLKPHTITMSLKARINVDEAGRGRIKKESLPLDILLKTEFTAVTVSGIVLCPSNTPISLARLEIFSTTAGKNYVLPYAHVTTFTDGNGGFVAALPARASSGSRVTAQIYCPGDEYPSLTVDGDVSNNACALGTILLLCPKCGGATASEE